MRRIYITLYALGTCLISNAQLDITPISTSGASTIVSQNSEDYFSPTITTSLTFIAQDESMTASVSLGDIAPNTGTNSAIDTLNSLEVIIWVQHTGLAVGTTLSRSYTVSSNLNSISVTDQTVTIAGNGGTGSNGEQLGTFYQIIVSNLKVLEGTSDVITFTNDGSTTLAIDAWTFRNKAASLEVISSTGNGILATQGVSINNPVLNGLLQFTNIPSYLQSEMIELVSLEGTVLLSKVISATDNSMDVTSLNSGVYLLRNPNTGSTKKIMIQ